MDEVSDKFVIQLYVGRQAHAITIPRDQEALYRKASRLVNEKLGRYEQTYPNLDAGRYTSVALLDFAVQAQKAEMLKDDTLYTETVERLSQEITNLLEEE